MKKSTPLNSSICPRIAHTLRGVPRYGSMYLSLLPPPFAIPLFLSPFPSLFSALFSLSSLPLSPQPFSQGYFARPPATTPFSLSVSFSPSLLWPLSLVYPLFPLLFSLLSVPLVPKFQTHQKQSSVHLQTITRDSSLRQLHHHHILFLPGEVSRRLTKKQAKQEDN